jgi:peptidoglycan L-alanyl-D-glutamate endopeptidase CwlK
MSYELGTRSRRNLATCHPDIQIVCNDAIRLVDFSVLCGHRGREAQEDAFESGASKLRWPFSRHNGLPATAVDLAPFPIDWNDLDRFADLAACMKWCAALRSISIEWGGEIWLPDFYDGPHFQLIR